MDSEDECSAHFTFLDMNYDSFFVIFQKNDLSSKKIFIKLSFKLRKKLYCLNKKVYQASHS